MEVIGYMILKATEENLKSITEEFMPMTLFDIDGRMEMGVIVKVQTVMRYRHDPNWKPNVNEIKSPVCKEFLVSMPDRDGMIPLVEITYGNMSLYDNLYKLGMDLNRYYPSCMLSLPDHEHPEFSEIRALTDMKTEDWGNIKAIRLIK